MNIKGLINFVVLSLPYSDCVFQLVVDLCFSWPRSSFCRNWSGTRPTWRRQTFWSTPWHAWHCPRGNPTPSESMRTRSSKSAVPVSILCVLELSNPIKFVKICAFAKNFHQECVKFIRFYNKKLVPAKNINWCCNYLTDWEIMLVALNEQETNLVISFQFIVLLHF